LSERGAAMPMAQQLRCSFQKLQHGGAGGG
jgi:hypothetical protein